MQRNFLTASGAYVQLNSGRARRYGFAPIAECAPIASRGYLRTRKEGANRFQGSSNR